jgi:lactate permease
VAFGAIGTPILTLGAVTGISPALLSAVAGRQLPFVSVLVPAWLVVTMSGWRGLRGAWPAVIAAGGTFALVQAAWSNFVGPELVDIVAALTSLAAVALCCRMWQPSSAEYGVRSAACDVRQPPTMGAVRAWMPWVLLSLFVVLWGLPPVKAALNGGRLAPIVHVPRLDRQVYRDYPVVPQPVNRAAVDDAAYRNAHAETATFTLNWLSATGTAILLAALLGAVLLGVKPRDIARVGAGTLRQLRWPLVTIALMLALGDVTRYSGTDATLGLAFTKTGVLYPFFAAMLGWLGVAITGSDTSANVLFGSLQAITARQLHLNPALIAAANSTGGVMGKMVAAQTIVVATAATNLQGHEGRLLRFVFWHSVALAVIMGLIVLMQAYWLEWMVP